MPEGVGDFPAIDVGAVGGSDAEMAGDRLEAVALMARWETS
ncbi:MAG TPA: hypothetical protein PKU89_02505 [Kiritimatiellia bacterium]|nr:hypothetical protein [Kiritimatiellia bacterium]